MKSSLTRINGRPGKPDTGEVVRLKMSAVDSRRLTPFSHLYVIQCSVSSVSLLKRVSTQICHTRYTDYLKLGYQFLSISIEFEGESNSKGHSSNWGFCFAFQLPVTFLNDVVCEFPFFFWSLFYLRGQKLIDQFVSFDLVVLEFFCLVQISFILFARWLFLKRHIGDSFCSQFSFDLNFIPQCSLIYSASSLLSSQLEGKLIESFVLSFSPLTNSIRLSFW